MTSWFNAGGMVPLDLDGPTDVSFERFEDEWIERPIVERFEAIALRYPQRVAVADGTRQFTYAELRSRAYALSRRLAAAVEHEPQRPVGILLPHDARFPVAELACLAAGLPFVPIDLKYPAARIKAIMREAQLAAVILEEASDGAGLVPGNIPGIDIDAARDHDAVAEFSCKGTADSLAVILYTSGSTGRPKGICNNQRAILQRVAEATNSCHLNIDDRSLLLSSPGTIAGQREIFAALLNGATLHMSDPQRDGVHSVLHRMTQGHITICYAVPSLLRVLLRLPGADRAFAHLRVIRVGGDITLASDFSLFRKVAPASCHFFASFSSTETPAVFQWFVPSGWQTSGPRVPIGYPRPGVDFAALREDGQAVATGEVGELVVRSRFLAVGEWQDGRMTQGRFMTDPDDPEMRILRTGDLVTQREDGLWELFGRKDRQIKIRGQRIDTGEVEAALRRCEGVADVAVLARRGNEEVIALAAFVAPVDAAALQQKDALLTSLRHCLKERVPKFMHPADIHLVQAIPQLPGFKPDMRALEDLDRELLAQREQAAPAERTQETQAKGGRTRARNVPVYLAVKHAWSVVLGARSFEADQTWDQANGDSLKAIELWFYIEDKLGFKLPLDAFDGDTRPSELVDTIAEHMAASADGSRAGAEQGASPLVFLFPGIQDDDPALARFRAGVGKRVRFRLIDYPGWRQTAAAGGSFDAIVDAAVAKICAQAPCDVYRVAGYSFGGIVAFEVAQRLSAMGRRVDFVGLLDARRWDLTRQHQSTDFHAFLDEQPNPRVDWLKSFIARRIRRRQFGLLGAIERLLMAYPTRLAFWYKRRLTRELRYQAFLQWRPAPLAVPTVLYLSDDRWPGEPEDHGWGELCPALATVHIGGNHASVLQSPYRESLCSAFVQAIENNEDAIGSGLPPHARREAPGDSDNSQGPESGWSPLYPQPHIARVP